MNRFASLGLFVLILGAAGVWWWQQSGANHLNNSASPSAGLVRSNFERQPFAPPTQQPGSLLVAPALSPRVLELNQQGLQALANDHPQAAVSLFEAALEMAPEQPILLGNLASALVSWAVVEQQQGDVSTALDLLARAVARNPHHVAAYYWLAHLQLRSGHRDAAKAHLEAALANGLEHAVLLRMRADIAAVEGELDLSVEIIQRAVELDPADEKLQERAAQLLAERAMFATFLTEATAHFDSRYDPHDPVIVAALPLLNRDLEAAWRDVVSLLGVQPQDRLLVIWLDADRYRWQAPVWSAALFDGRVRIVIEDYAREQETIRRTLRHELTHAVMHTIGSPLPTWLHEGLAQSAEGSHRQAASAKMLLEGPNKSLSQLDGDWTIWTDRAQVTQAYVYALAFCDWLRAEYGQSVMANLFLNLKERSFEEAWVLTFGASLADSDTSFRESVKNL